MRQFLLLALLSLSSILFAESWNSFAYYPALDVFYHPVSTEVPKAEEAFSRGLLAIYAFNYDESYASFKRASEVDPNLAMAYWGMALVLDKNEATEETEKNCFLLTQKALSLSKNATENEQAYISALAKKFSSDPKPDKKGLRKAYADAMSKLAASYPDDPDAVTLSAESQMDLMSWNLWTSEGAARKGCPEILSQLESVLKKYPMHAGANHYYIHCVENSKNPERGLMCAHRLDSAYTDWGHLLHTSSHIYMRVGSYQETVDANKNAIEADKKYIAQHGLKGKYIPTFYTHNLFFLSRAYLWQERYAEAISSIDDLTNFTSAHLNIESDAEYYSVMPLQAYLYFQRWKEILAFPEPAKEKHFARAFWHFARATVFASIADLGKAQKEKMSFLAEKEKNETEKKVLTIAEGLLNAALAQAQGKSIERVEILKKTVEHQENLDYLMWYYPIRQTLGAALIKIGRFAEAESVFRESLDWLPRNGRSLFGLSKALEFQGKKDYSIERELKNALKYAAYPLTLEKL